MNDENSQIQNTSPKTTPESSKKPPKSKLKFIIFTISIVIAFIIGAGLTYFLLNISKGDNQDNHTVSNKSSDITNSPTSLHSTTIPQDNNSDHLYGSVTASNVDLNDSSKLISGEYAPFWPLQNFSLNIPNGMKIERTIDITTDGQLGHSGNEGGSSCGGGGGTNINVMSILSIKSSRVTGSTQILNYPTKLGCGGAEIDYIEYVKYQKLSGIPGYKYMELVYSICNEIADTIDSYDASILKCKKADGHDSSNWKLESGIVPASNSEFNEGDVSDPTTILSGLANREMNEPIMGIECKEDGKNPLYLDCTNKNSGFSDYKSLLNDGAYKAIKSTLIEIH